MTTTLSFCLIILYFRLEVLINYLFLFAIFCNVLKKLFRFSIKPLFRIRFRKISYCLISSIVFVLFGFSSIGNKGVPRCLQYPEKNVIKLLIILRKIACFFIHRQPKIIRCCPYFVMSKETRLLVQFSIDNVR